jgi:hypothetical protein
VSIVNSGIGSHTPCFSVTRYDSVRQADIVSGIIMQAEKARQADTIGCQSRLCQAGKYIQWADIIIRANSVRQAHKASGKTVPACRLTQKGGLTQSDTVNKINTVNREISSVRADSVSQPDTVSGSTQQVTQSDSQAGLVRQADIIGQAGTN